ncbi:hypothetical protein [Stratiformator vulcanicus]|uniref:Uncharacterized protein n=1 Tax=Stratiformator vulcanicus TaxID=2527980 RepID=A0A517QWU7_9PLAN|nr:hypothetical protein [Stratiformator vulcanicus]QDT36053.1 hypothetical protein Pan189_04080 [Stratiformator vulcanicus]
MKSIDLYRAVARATGETVQTIKHRGFGPDEEDKSGSYIDWDAVDLRRNTSLFSQRSRKQTT